MNLAELIDAAAAIKPAMGEPCNHCGWCCLTEVCATGQEFGAGTSIPCKKLEQTAEGWKCTLALQNIPIMNEHLGIGTGCDAMTQQERISNLLGD